MFSLSLETATAQFFDRALVANKVDRATRKVLSRFGAFVRTRSRSSIRKRKGISEPGKPPSSHTGKLRDFIFFAFDPAKKAVVIGPVKLDKPGIACELLEYGGDGRQQRNKRIRDVHYRQRPYMGPAFTTELDKMPPLWRDSVK